jgi:hypothetical protein
MKVTAAALACGALLASASGSVARSACPQLVDPRGDSVSTGDAAGDLVSVAASSDARTLTLGVTYAGETAARTPADGHSYVVSLSDGEATVKAWADVSPMTTTFTLYRGSASQSSEQASADAGTAIGSFPGRVDPVAHRVTMTVPFSLATDVLRPGRRLELSAMLMNAVMTPEIPVTGHAATWSSSDLSDTPATYRLGAKGC